MINYLMMVKYIIKRKIFPLQKVTIMSKKTQNLRFRLRVFFFLLNYPQVFEFKT